MKTKRNEIGGVLFDAGVRLSRQPQDGRGWNELWTLKSATAQLGRRRYPKRYRKREAIEIIRDVADAIENRRKEKRANHRSRAPRYRLPEGTPQERLAKRQIAMTRAAVDRTQKRYARQSTTSISWTTFSGCELLLSKCMGWVEYSRRFGNRFGVLDAHYIAKFQRGWTRLPHWLRVCDGLLTLGALRQADDEQEGETVYRAKWARPARGDVETVEGFIVRRQHEGREYTAHGRTIGAARSCITRQLPAYVAAATERERKRAERIERLKARIAKRLEEGRLNGWGEFVVTLADSRRAGNCPDGTAAWAYRHFPDRTEAPIAEVLNIDDQHERVLMACVAAIRRQDPDA